MKTKASAIICLDICCILLKRCLEIQQIAPGNLKKNIITDKWNIYQWNISCHISEQRMSQSSAIAATAEGELVSPEGTQKRKEYLPSSSPQTAATPCGEPCGNSGCENTGHWPQRAEVPIKGGIQ